jgi:phage tail sheath gpL-like
MPNNVTGITDASGAISTISGLSKTVCIVGAKATGASATAKTIFDVYGTSDAEAKWGATSLAAKLVRVLITNGVTSIKGIMTPDIDGTLTTKALTYDAAFDELLKDSNIGVVIIDEVDSTVIDKLSDHLALAEAEDKFRLGVVGMTAGKTNAELTTFAATLADKRMYTAGPNTLDTDGAAQSGIYLAAGLASAIATETNDPALPLNGVALEGFGGLERVLLKSEIDALIAGGVIPMYTGDDGKPTIYRAVSTYTTDATWQELTTVMIADDILASCINRIKTNYKRTKNVARILNAMRTDIVDILQKKNDLEIIENFNSKLVSVAKDPDDNYGALIDYEFDVVTPLYNVTIRQHMKL